VVGPDNLPEGRSLLAGDSGRGASAKYQIARQQAPTENRWASDFERAMELRPNADTA